MSALALYKTLATDVSPPAKKAHLQVSAIKIQVRQQHEKDSSAADFPTTRKPMHTIAMPSCFLFSNTAFVSLSQCDHSYNAVGTR